MKWKQRWRTFVRGLTPADALYLPVALLVLFALIGFVQGLLGLT